MPLARRRYFPNLSGGLFKLFVVFVLAVLMTLSVDRTRYIPQNLPGRPANLFDVSWLGPDAHLLNPAVAP